jgi:hypothetical protein
MSPKRLEEESPVKFVKPASNLEQIKDWYYTSLLICFAGIISLYSGYAFL